MRHHGSLALLCSCLACGSSTDEGQSQPSSCDPASREGSYLATFETLSGDCGDQASALLRLDADADPADSGCSRLSEDRWSDGNCTLERSLVCPYDSFAPGATISSVGITTQRDSSGETITGTMTITVKDADGITLCLGTYRMTAARQ